MAGLAIICSGQGKQSHDMFDALLDYPEAAALYNRVTAECLPGIDLRNPSEDIFRNDVAQPALCLYQMMVWEVIRKDLPEVDIFAGYSLGELGAYACAGVFSPEVLVKIAAVRGRIMTESASGTPQSMAGVIGLRRPQVDDLCGKFAAAVAIVNGPDHFVCGMPLDKVDDYCAAALKLGAVKAVHVPVTVASHTFYMDKAAGIFRPELEKVECNSVFGRVLAGINGGKVFSRDQMLDVLCAQMHHTIDWRGCMESAYSYGCRIFFELGPGSALKRMLTAALPDVQAYSAGDFHDLRGVSKWLAAVMRRLSD
ncbi:MAG: ACP S-malonyltransferase [Victivallaceae bacterium]|nr:acyltransferase domain-containing protein [Victivallaceae bacterium]